MTEVQLQGNFDHVSTWDDAPECSGSPAALRQTDYPAWHRDLLKRPKLHPLVGGTEVVERFGLLLIPPMAWPDPVSRSALGFPVYEDGKLVNLIRRFFDGKPRYKGLRGRGHQLWPQLERGDRALIVCGMRDACWGRAAGLPAYSGTGGVERWPDEWLERLAGRQITVCFDRGEEEHAERLATRCGARVLRLPETRTYGYDLADLARDRGLAAVRKFARRRP